MCISNEGWLSCLNGQLARHLVKSCILSPLLRVATLSSVTVTHVGLCLDLICVSVSTELTNGALRLLLTAAIVCPPAFLNHFKGCLGSSWPSAFPYEF